jgi:hypothetical protein
VPTSGRLPLCNIGFSRKGVTYCNHDVESIASCERNLVNTRGYARWRRSTADQGDMQLKPPSYAWCSRTGLCKHRSTAWHTPSSVLWRSPLASCRSCTGTFTSASHLKAQAAGVLEAVHRYDRAREQQPNGRRYPLWRVATGDCMRAPRVLSSAPVPSERGTTLTEACRGAAVRRPTRACAWVHKWQGDMQLKPL